MAKKITVFFIILLMLVPISAIVFSAKGSAAPVNQSNARSFFEDRVLSTKPCTNPDGTPFTIAYVDIDPYPASGEMLYYLIDEMEREGWIHLDAQLPFDSADTDAKELIRYLSQQDLGDFIRFTDDANYYIAVDDRDACIESLREHVQKKDIDLILCMGTSPGEMVIHEMGITEVPVMVYFSVDPVAAGLSLSQEYSGTPNVWCHTGADVYVNQLQFYYDNYPFTNIGMVYYSESVGAMAQYRDGAKRIGCRISERQIETLSSSDRADTEAYYDMLRKTFTELIEDEQIDAFMLGTDIIKDVARIPEYLDMFYDAGIPVFVQNGEYYVEQGALLAVTASDAKAQAPFAINAMSMIFHGEEPGSVYQKFVISPYVSLNADAAKRLQYTPKEDLLLMAEKIHQKSE